MKYIVLAIAYGILAFMGETAQTEAVMLSLEPLM